MSRSFTYFATLFLLWLGANTEVLAEEQSSTDLAEPGLTLYQLLLGNIALSDGDNQMAYEMLKSAAEKLNNTNSCSMNSSPKIAKILVAMLQRSLAA